MALAVGNPTNVKQPSESDDVSQAPNTSKLELLHQRKLQLFIVLLFIITFFAGLYHSPNWYNQTSFIVNLLVFILFTNLCFFGVLSLAYVVYRLYGGIAKRIWKDINYQPSGSLVYAIFGLVISLVGWLVGYYAIFNHPSFGQIVSDAYTFSALLFASSIGILVIYFLGSLISWVIGHFVHHRPIFSLKKRLFYTLVGFTTVGIIFLVSLVVIYGLFGGFGSLFTTTSSYGGAGTGISSSLGAPMGNLAGPPAMFDMAPGQSFRGIGGGAPMTAQESIGLSTGGAKDIGNFRENINNNYLPLPTDITYEGLFYDYFFDTGELQPCDDLFCPSYSYAVSYDPFSYEPEYYLSVGLNSGIKQADFARKKLNLVIVLDISGSMASPFNRYYYDSSGQHQTVPDEDFSNKQKMQVANESVVALLDHLQTGDRFGLVLFDDSAQVKQPLTPWEQINQTNLKQQILAINDQGGTNMEAGIRQGTSLLSPLVNSNPEDYENRIIFITDAQPNTGNTSEQGLVSMAQTNAQNGIYTTFIGVGVDFNSQLIESITKTKGANYYAAHTANDFADRMDEGFEYMVTPLVFDLVLEVTSPDFTIEKVYGSPEADAATGEIMKVNTLFPSEKQDGEVKGGLVLLKLQKNTNNPIGTVNLYAKYKDRSNQGFSNQSSALIIDSDTDYFENTGIQKGVLLARYVNLLRNWIYYERQVNLPQNQHIEYMDQEIGITIPPEPDTSQWERTSIPLRISREFKQYMDEFSDYFQTEMALIGDEALNQEVEVLEKLIKS